MKLAERFGRIAARFALGFTFAKHPALRWIVVMALPLLTLRALFAQRGIIYSRHSDLIAQFLSMKVAGRRALSEDGMVPIWDPAMNAGTPALANPQSGFFNPLEWLYFILPLDLAANVHVLVTVAVAAAAMYLLARDVLSHPGSALVCSLGYALAFRLLATIHTGWIPNLVVYAFVPLLPWALRRLYSAPSARGAVVLALVIGLLFSQGDLQQLYYAAIATAVYSFVLWFGAPRALRAKVATLTLAALAIGVLLASPAMLPRLEYAALSTRHVTDYRFFLRRPPLLEDLRRLLDPEIAAGAREEFWENNFYFGIWLVPLWFAAFLGNPRRALPLALAVVPAVALCFDSPLLRLAYDWLPGFGMFRQTPRILFGVQLLLALLAGVGVDTLCNPKTQASIPRISAIVGIATALAAGCASRAELHRALPLLGLLGLFSALLLVLPKRPAFLVALCCAMPLLDAERHSVPILEVRPLAEVAPVTRLQHDLRRSPGRGRTMVIGPTTLAYGMAGLYDIDLVNGYSGIMLNHFIEYFDLLQQGELPKEPRPPTVWNETRSLALPEMLRALDVTTIITDRVLPLESAGFELHSNYPETPTFVFYRGLEPRNVHLWRAKRPLGPAYFATELRPAPREPDQLLQAIAQSASARVAHVDGVESPAFGILPATSSVVETRRGANRYAYELETSNEGFLILSQVFYPGWEAFLDGTPIALTRTNHTLIGCGIPKGKHRLELRMTSQAFEVGLMLAALGALLAMLWWVRASDGFRIRHEAD